MEWTVLTADITEEVTATDVKDILGYPDDDQDTRIERLITVAREWLEARTGVSAVAKSYKARFEKADRDSEGYYELPFSPVIGTPDPVQVCGVEVTFDQKGLERVRVRPATSYATIPVGGTSPYYVDVTFTAGRSSETMNELIRRIVVTMFNAPQDGAGEGVMAGRLPFDTIRLIDSINQNTGL